MIIDVHCHYTFSARVADARERFSFEPATVAGRPTIDSWVSPRSLRRITWRLTRRMLGVGAANGPELDDALDRFYEPHFFEPGPVDRIVLLAFDSYHDDEGRRPPPPERRSQLGGDIYTSNTLIREMCQRRPDRFLFGASVHPYRENAVACIEEVFKQGACLLKWIPLHQNIDIADPRTVAVLRRCAELGLPLLVHYNGEFTLTTQHPEHQPVSALLHVLRKLRLEASMPIVIAAHAATPVTPFGDRNSHTAFLSALAGEFADAPLYADISALTSWGKVGFLRKLARRQDLHAKLLFGSDFPVPVAMPRLRRDLGRDYARIRSRKSWIQQTAEIYRRMGFNEIVFHRAADLLPNVNCFRDAANRHSEKRSAEESSRST